MDTCSNISNPDLNYFDPSSVSPTREGDGCSDCLLIMNNLGANGANGGKIVRLTYSSVVPCVPNHINIKIGEEIHTNTVFTNNTPISKIITKFKSRVITK